MCLLKLTSYKMMQVLWTVTDQVKWLKILLMCGPSNEEPTFAKEVTTTKLLHKTLVTSQCKHNPSPPPFNVVYILKIGSIVDYRISVPVTLDCLAVCSECLNAFSEHFWTDAVCVEDAETDDPKRLLSLQSFVVRCLHELTMSFRSDANLIVCLFVLDFLF